ncbi:hypothetical protein [Ruminococcus albus]|uniref:Cohesin domain-containing protein n=1 Tax=Ruminococcus albus TaxID=1264 RepID=A0A1I1H2H9_RUMAL|nr:hypothetical protein [Ruminococcus albus]SFC15400.1 hypothetical protein SAMN02910406_01235 [Ruminococcus albus]
MFIKRFAAVIAAALAVTAAVPSVYAEYGYDPTYDYNTYDYNNYDYNNYDYNNYDYNYDNGYDNGGYEETTTTTAPDPGYDPAQSAGNEVTAMENKATTLVPDKPTSAPSKVYLKPGEFKDDAVSVELRIEADSAVSSALMSVAFDTALLQLESTQINPEAGGKAAENSFNGKYVFNYTNDSGSKFQGNYVTLNFKVLDKDMVSTTLFLTVTTLDNKTGIPISYSVENGIIANPDAPGYNGEETKAPKLNPLVKVQKSIGQAAPSEMGIENYRNIVVADPSIVSFENGVFKMLAAGETSFDVVFNNDELKTYDIIIFDDTNTTDAQDRAVAATDNKSNGVDKTVRNLFIIIAIALTMIIIAVEYLIIMKPTSKRRKKLAAAEAFFEREEQEDDDEDEEEMREDLKKAFAARDARRKSLRGEEEPEVEEEAPEEQDDADAETSEDNDNGDEE